MTPLPSFVVCAQILASLPPPSAPPAVPAEAASAPEADATRLQKLLHEIQAAERRANEDPKAGLPALAELLETLPEREPVLAGHDQILAARILAQLTLARGYLALQDRKRAGQAMDEAIRLAGTRPLPLNLFGPKLENFAVERRAILETRGRGKLVVECTVPCSVRVNEQPAKEANEGLFLGTYRVRVEPKTAGPDPLQAEVTLQTHGETKVVRYAPRPPAPAVSEPATPADETPRRRAAGKRLAPLWSELLLAGTGVGAAAGGAVMLALDGRCASEPATPGDPCPDLYEFTAGGAALTAVGGALLVSGVTLAIVDAVRTRRADEPAGARKGRRRASFGPAGLAWRF